MGSAKFAHASNCRKMARNDDRERMGFARTGEVKSPYRGEAEPMKGSIEV